MAGAEAAIGFDVVIVNWYAWDALRRCVEHVVAAASNVSDTVRIVVVDNSLDAPPAGLVDWLEDRARLVRPGRNLGFGAACNLGAARGAAPAILFLNADAWPYPGALAAAAARLTDEDAAPGVVGAQMVDTRGCVVSSCWRFPTLGRLTVEALGLDRLRPFHRWGCRMRDADHGTLQPVDQVIGAFLAIRRDVFAAVGGFDERFFLYYEEVDLCRAVRAAGREVLFDPSIMFTHAAERLTPDTLAPRLAYNAHSRIVYARKHFGRLGAAYVTGLAFVVEPLVRIIASVFSTRGTPPRATARYLANLWRGLRRGGWTRSVALDAPTD